MDSPSHQGGGSRIFGRKLPAIYKDETLIAGYDFVNEPLLFVNKDKWATLANEMLTCLSIAHAGAVFKR